MNNLSKNYIYYNVYLSMLKKLFIPILFFILVIGCSKKEEKIQLPARDFDKKIQIVDEFNVEEGIYQVVDNVYVAIGYALANSILDCW